MNFTQWATVIGLLLTNAGVLFGMWQYFDNRIGRVYSRLDEVKNDAETKYVRKDMCSIMHASSVKEIEGIEDRMIARFEQVEGKVDRMENKIDKVLAKLDALPR